jgi:glycosyltransferase involved in cell wall biosynthesis
LYQRLACRKDIAIKVFFTWHAGQEAMHDRGFKTQVAWDIPLTAGYDFELVPNVSSRPGTHHFLGLRNPSLMRQVLSWQPDIVHITGWAWYSHLLALRILRKKSIPTLFRGDSHLLDVKQDRAKWWIKRAILHRVFSWPSGFLVVGSANRAYYEAFGVNAEQLFPCPHSIDVDRFAKPNDVFEEEAAQWREQLGISAERSVLLYAGKFENKKRPVELMRTVLALRDPKPILIMVGSGELEGEVDYLAKSNPEQFRVLPFQNQSIMPIVYRLGDLFVLPSAFGETWGLAVNEAMACGRPVLVSDRVGCARDVVDASCGEIFSQNDPMSIMTTLNEMLRDRDKLLRMGRAAQVRSRLFDIPRTEETLMGSISRLLYQ